jgi:putative heme iron utilization protein
MEQEEITKLAKEFLRNRDVGILSTLHDINDELFPYGSICPFISTLESKIVILISDIALHTKNILQTKRVGFTVFDMEAKNKQAGGRVSIMGLATKIDPERREDYPEIKDRYLTFFPSAEHYFSAHDFNFYEVIPEKIHFIKTFGQIFTFSGDQFLNDRPFTKEAADFAIKHMNDDHQDMLALLSSHLGLKTDQTKKIISLNREGFHLKMGDVIRYISFLEPTLSDKDLRLAFTALYHQLKEKKS